MFLKILFCINYEKKAEKILKLNPKNFRLISDNMQTTLERKLDFLKRVVSPNKDQKDYVLHIEFQTGDESDMMRYRMNEHYAILLRNHKLDVHQVVFFIGERKAKMRKSIERKNSSFSFEIINIQDYSYKLFTFGATS